MFTIEVADPGSPEADAMVKAYFADIASRWHGRPVTDDEVRQAMIGEPYDDLREPTGLFLVASTDGEAAACAGVRFGEGVAELTKVFTLPKHRGKGAGRRLLGAVEQACRDREIVTLRLATRAQLSEACALYERLGFIRVAAFNRDPFSDRWYSRAVSITTRPDALNGSIAGAARDHSTGGVTS